MKPLSILSLLIAIGVAFTSCLKDDDLGVPDTSDKSGKSSSDKLVFGHYYGMCGGEECVEIFKLEAGQLMEDTLDNYPSNSTFYTANYITLSAAKYNIASDLWSHIPANLLATPDSTFGCPDCADQGGLYIEYQDSLIHRFWRIDQAKGGVPAYLHNFMDKVNEKIELINT